jgi:hypothetical protein
MNITSTYVYTTTVYPEAAYNSAQISAFLWQVDIRGGMESINVLFYSVALSYTLKIPGVV